MTGFDSKRQAAQAKLDDDDDTQIYSDALLSVYQSGFADGKKAAEQQIAKALQQHGLSLVKTADGYAAMKLGPITAHNIKEGT